MSGKMNVDRKNVEAPVPDKIMKMSNLDILNEIDLILEKNDQMDVEKLEQYLDLLQDRVPIVQDYDVEAAWSEFKVNNAELFANMEDTPKIQAKAKKQRKKRRNWGSKVFRIGEVAAAAMLILVVSANAIGVNPIQPIVKWAQEALMIQKHPSGTMELPANTDSEFQSLEEALEQNSLPTECSPTWVPERFSLDEVMVRENGGSVKYSAVYTANAGDLIIRVTYHSAPQWNIAEEKDAGGYIYEYNDEEYYIITNLEQSKAVWQEEDCSYTISGQITEDEIKEMIHSIK